MRIDIWTDGSCNPNPGPGGWAVILVSGTRRKEFSGYLEKTTNIRSEIIALIEALKALRNGPHQVVVHTDSQYVKLALDGMKRPRANFDLMREADALKRQHRVTVEWIPGHAGDPNNERCDRLAKMAAAEGAERSEAPPNEVRRWSQSQRMHAASQRVTDESSQIR